MDYSKQRATMVEEQLVKRGITDARVLKAMGTIAREEFIPKDFRQYAYDDSPVAIGEGQTISQPFMVAVMSQSLGLSGDEIVFEIGTGSGYQTAVLAALAKEVYSLERIESLARFAQDNLKRLNITNAFVSCADGSLGSQQKGCLFDAAIVTAASPARLNHLFTQMNERARMVIPVGDRSMQRLLLLTKTEGTIEEQEICRCVFVPLLGQYGFGL